MKQQTMILLACVGALLLLAACTTVPGAPHLELNTYKYDLGDIDPANGIVQHDFTIMNTGGAPLVISAVSTSCGCTTATVDNETIAPGSSTTLHVAYDPSVHQGLVGKLKRVVYVQSNDPAQEEVELELSGNQIASNETSVADEHEHAEHEENLAPYEVSPFDTYEHVEAGDVKLLDVREPSEFEQDHIAGALLLPLGNITQSSLDALGLAKDDEIIIYCHSGKRSARAYDIMQDLGYTDIKSMNGGITHWMEEEFPVEQGAAVPAAAPLTGAPSVTVDKEEFDFGMVDPANGTVNTTFTVTNTGDAVLVLSDISTSCGCTSATLDKESLQPGERATLTVFFDPNVHEEPKDRFSRTVFIETNDPAMPELDVKIYVDIIEAQA